LCFSHVAIAGFDDIDRIFHESPTRKAFEVCQSGGCAKVSASSLSDKDWLQISQLFNPVAMDAGGERKQLAQAIGVFERIIGEKIGTSGDLAGTFNMAHGQQDCNDEAINTTTYMRLLYKNGYLNFHKIEDMRTRNFFFTGWPHTTAVIREIGSGERFAVDSWFYDNGHPATIVPFVVWKANYKPADSPIGKSRKLITSPAEASTKP
jgi:hypothetical protein